jgi:hypothetical protein
MSTAARIAVLALGLLAAACETAGPPTGSIGKPTDGSLIANGSFEAWEGETPGMPDQWRLVEWEGGSQLAEGAKTEDVRDGKKSLRIAAGTSVVSLSNALALADPANAHLRGRTVTAGAWVKASAPGAAFITIRHGAEEAELVDHPGDGSWQYLTVTTTVGASDDAVAVRVGNRLQDGKTAVFFDGVALVEGSAVPAALAGR